MLSTITVGHKKDKRIRPLSTFDFINAYIFVGENVVDKSG